MNKPVATLTFGDKTVELPASLVYALQTTALARVREAKSEDDMFLKFDEVRDICAIAQEMRTYRPTARAGGFGETFNFYLDAEVIGQGRTINLAEHLGRDIAHNTLGGLTLVGIEVEIDGRVVTLTVVDDYSPAPDATMRLRHGSYCTIIDGAKIEVSGNVDVERLIYSAYMSENIRRLEFSTYIHFHQHFVNVGDMQLLEEVVDQLAGDPKALPDLQKVIALRQGVVASKKSGVLVITNGDSTIELTDDQLTLFSAHDLSFKAAVEALVPKQS